MAYLFSPVVPCASGHFKGEGYAVTADITSHFKSKLQQWPINLSAALCIRKRRTEMVYLFDYAVYQLCMKQLHTTALRRGWKRKGRILTKSLSSAAFTGPAIRPSGWPFAPANLCLLVYLSVYSGKEILFLSVSAAQIFILWLNLQSFSIWAKESSGTGCIDNKRANIKAQPGGRGAALASGDRRSQMRSKDLDLSRLRLMGL